MSKADYSDNEDDPPVYESSGSEWNSSSEFETKRRNNRRTSSRVSKKPRITTHSTSTDSESEDDPKPRKKNGVNKKPKIEIETPTPVKKAVPKPINSKDYSTGSFLILKKDAQVGDPNKPPCIWRIDGKALLQKYEPFDDDGKIRHKTTSVYTGWSALDRDLYAPVVVSVKQHNNHTLIVDLDWEQLKKINMDSD